MDMGAGASKSAPGIVVTLDALGTIYKFREPVITQYIKVAKRSGLNAPISEENLSQAFRKSYKALCAELPNYGKGHLSGPRAWWKTLVNDAFRQVVEESAIPDQLGENLYNHFTSVAAYELYPDVRPFFASMRELKQRRSNLDGPAVFVGVISNSDPRVRSVLQSMGLRVGIDSMPKTESFKERTSRIWESGLSGDEASAASGEGTSSSIQSIWHDAYDARNDIDFLATSYVAGEEKPHPQIFNFAASLAAVNYASRLEQGRSDWKPGLGMVHWKYQVASQIDAIYKAKFIHIGDDFDKDYLGASENKFEAIHLAREGEVESVEGATTVTDLEQAAVTVRVIADQELSST